MSVTIPECAERAKRPLDPGTTRFYKGTEPQVIDLVKWAESRRWILKPVANVDHRDRHNATVATTTSAAEIRAVQSGVRNTYVVFLTQRSRGLFRICYHPPVARQCLRHQASSRPASSVA